MRLTRDIIRAASLVTGIPVSCIIDNRRFNSEMPVKTAIILVAREHGHSYPRIAASMRRDHTTLIYALRRHKHSAITQRIAQGIRERLIEPTWRDRLREQMERLHAGPSA